MIGAYILTDEKAYAKAEGLLGQVVEVFHDFQEEDTLPMPQVIAPCTQGQIAKIVAYTYLGDALVEGAPEGATWHSKYYTALAQDGRFPFLVETNAQQPMTYEMTFALLKVIAGDTLSMTTQGTTTLQETITLSDFVAAYEQALAYSTNPSTLTYEELSVLGTLSTQTMLAPWQVATSKGVYGFEGLIMDPYKDYTIKVLVHDQEILGILETLSAQGVVEQCYIQSVAEGMATVQIGGLTFQYEAPELSTSAIGTVGQITLANNQIIAFVAQQDETVDTLVRVDSDTIELCSAGTLPYDTIRVYDGMGKEKYTHASQLFSGAQVTYTLQDGKVETLTVVDDTLDDTIRVVISEDGLGDYTHDTVQINAEGAYTVTTDTGVVQQYAANMPWSSEDFSWEKQVSKLTIEGVDAKGLYIQSITRQGIHPLYEGTLEIYKEGDCFEVVNVLPVENYVAAVIPSEMPTSYGLEAAKVQAVAARSYALSKRKTSQYLGYGAQVDDTVATQVYNRVPVDAISRQATEETAGEVLVHNDQIISGNFFATSCGYTANYGETWANGEIFPTNTPVYLVARQQYIGNRLVDDLSKEKDAYSFLTRDASEVEAFDQDSPWFRWQVNVSGEVLQEMIENQLYRLTTQYPNLVKIKDDTNKWVIGEIKTIGAITSLEVTERGSGGNIMELIIEGKEGTLKVSTEYLVRSLLAPMTYDAEKEAIQIVRADESIVENMAMLPSAFFTMDMTHATDNTIDTLTLYGGGFGHGVGMSQDGVKGMAHMGYTYKEILRHYYAETEIKTL